MSDKDTSLFEKWDPYRIESVVTHQKHVLQYGSPRRDSLELQCSARAFACFHGHRGASTEHRGASTEHRSASTKHRSASYEHRGVSYEHCGVSYEHRDALEKHRRVSHEHRRASGEHLAKRFEHLDDNFEHLANDLSTWLRISSTCGRQHVASERRFRALPPLS